jgi:hypothetical protein
MYLKGSMGYQHGVIHDYATRIRGEMLSTRAIKGRRKDKQHALPENIAILASIDYGADGAHTIAVQRSNTGMVRPMSKITITTRQPR